MLFLSEFFLDCIREHSWCLKELLFCETCRESICMKKVCSPRGSIPFDRLPEFPGRLPSRFPCDSPLPCDTKLTSRFPVAIATGAGDVFCSPLAELLGLPPMPPLPIQCSSKLSLTRSPFIAFEKTESGVRYYILRSNRIAQTPGSSVACVCLCVLLLQGDLSLLLFVACC
ncbi:hypothetical protein CDAR_258041 [Caerostris darwini]|uniref:Uncharacterized protein n=1 Tax=Caerostris darwini TaxID=1538125 RepID=A0AAV4WXF2_9ARAC|nr:hypothetical protein CDAR_258041 [Caerostris darwini]